MFKGLYTTGDEMTDRILYVVLTIIILGAFIFFGMPLIEMALGMNWMHPFF